MLVFLNHVSLFVFRRGFFQAKLAAFDLVHDTLDSRLDFVLPLVRLLLIRLLVQEVAVHAMRR